MAEPSSDADGISLEAETVPSDEGFDFFGTGTAQPESDSFITGSVVQGKNTNSRVKSDGPGTSLRKPSASGKEDEAKSTPPRPDEWQDFWSRIVIRLATDYYIDRAFSDIDEDWLSEREVARIRLSEKERDRIARPIAELSNKLKFTRKHGRTIIASAGSIDSLIQLGMWVTRVNRIAAKYRNMTNRPAPQRTSRGSGIVSFSRPVRQQPQSVAPENVPASKEGGNENVSTGQNPADGADGRYIQPDGWRPGIAGDIFNPDAG